MRAVKSCLCDFQTIAMDCEYKVECIYVKPEINIEELLVSENEDLQNTKKHISKIQNIAERVSNEERLEMRRIRQRKYRNSMTIEQREGIKEKRRIFTTVEQREKQRARQKKYREKKKRNKFDALMEGKISNSNSSESVCNLSYPPLNDDIKRKWKNKKKCGVKHQCKGSMTDEEREKMRAMRRFQYHALPDERREKIKAAQRERSRKVYYSMSEEQRERRKAMHFTYLASLTEEQLEMRKAARRESVRKYRRSLTEEQREVMKAARRKKVLSFENRCGVLNMAPKKSSFQSVETNKKLVNINSIKSNSKSNSDLKLNESNECDLKSNVDCLQGNVLFDNKILTKDVKVEIKREIQWPLIKNNEYNDDADSNSIACNTREAEIRSNNNVCISNDTEKEMKNILNGNYSSFKETDPIFKNTIQSNDQTFVSKTKIKIKNEKKKVGRRKISDTNKIAMTEKVIEEISYLQKNEARRKRVATMTDDERERKRAERRRYYHSLSEEKREKFKAAQRERLRRVYHTMTEEQREQRKAMHFTYLASLTEEQLEKRKAARRESVRKYRRSLNEEQREMMKAARRKPKP